jgi:hypothetical protein
MRGILVVRFVDIDGIVDHHCLNYLSIAKLSLVNNNFSQISLAKVCG